ncbi:hypothetical protein CA13_28700 [Planctomycetes bacterium CA13]|uniref:Alpha glucuronidase N-terminal domain-containing protein n=2 Tax=Novipirellula herctigrandis TaxID=2527986 RepID=A0A5C5Z395_9BACT|nr:hypothetical protein CA13_28700 [Planctomycetes bacterium CA13]
MTRKAAMSMILWTVVLILMSESANAGVVVLAQKGPIPAQEEVVWNDDDITDDNACTMAFAADELQKFLRLITQHEEDWAVVDSADAGNENQVVLTLVAASEVQKPLGNEGYIISTRNFGTSWRVEIKATSRIGILYGAYDFLNRLGVRWFSPGEPGQVVPSSELKTIPSINTVEKPDFLLRGFHAWEDRADHDFLLWMARNRLNYWCIQQSNKPMLHKLGIRLAGAEHRIHSWYLGATNPYPYDHENFKGDDTRPADPYPTSPSYAGDENEDGSLSYYEAHPEWYGLVKGKRIPGPGSPKGKGIRHGVNFCTSNQDALSEFVKNAVEDLETGRLKQAAIVNVWLLDNAQWCECENCQKTGSPTDRNLRVVHALDRAIKVARQEGRIKRTIRLLFLTYNDVIDPPTRPLPDDFDYDTCIATFFPIRRCYVHDMQDEHCDLNSRFNGIFNDWTVSADRHYRGQMFVGEYYNVSRFKSLPMSFMNTMSQDIPYYHKLGARYFHYMHVSTKNWGNKALTNWQMAQQLWDVEADVEALWKDYFLTRYGKAADEMRRFYEGLEPMLSNVTWLKYTAGPNLNRGSKDAFKGSHLSYDQTGVGPSLLDMRKSGDACRSIINRVIAMELPERVRQRVLENERMLAYGELTLEYYDLAEQGFDAVRRNETAEANQLLEQLETVASKLKQDTVSASNAGEHANAENALDATYANGAARALRRKIAKMTGTK